VDPKPDALGGGTLTRAEKPERGADRLAKAQAADLLAQFRQKEQVVELYVKQETEILDVQKRYGRIKEDAYQTEIDRLVEVRVNGLAQIASAEAEFLQRHLATMKADSAERVQVQTQLDTALARAERSQLDARQTARVRAEQGLGEAAERRREVDALRAGSEADVRKLGEQQALARQQRLGEVARTNQPEEVAIRALARLETEKAYLSEVEKFRKSIDELEAKGDPKSLEKVGVLREMLPLLEEQRKLQSQLNEEQAVAIYNRQREFTFGAEAAFKAYVESATNAAQQARDLFTSAFSGMERAIEEFANTGKINFRSLASSIIAEITKIQAKAAAAEILNGVKGSFPGFASAAGSLISGNFGGLGGFLGFGGGGTGFTSGFSGVAELPFLHGGGIVGAERTFSREAPLLSFARAPRYHTGGISGEQPAVLQHGEGVFTPGQMRALAPKADTRPIVVNNHISMPAGTTRETANMVAARVGAQSQRALRRFG